MVNLTVVVEVEELSARRLTRVGVVGVTAVAKLTEGRGRAEERDALVACLELLMDMAGKHDSHWATSKNPQQTIAADQPAVRLRARREGRMMQTQHRMRLDTLETASQQGECAIGDASGLVSDPLAVQQGQRPMVRKLDEPPILDLAEHHSHGRRVIMVAGDEVSARRPALRECIGEPIRLDRAVVGNVTRRDDRIDRRERSALAGQHQVPLVGLVHDATHALVDRLDESFVELNPNRGFQVAMACVGADEHHELFSTVRHGKRI